MNFNLETKVTGGKYLAKVTLDPNASSDLSAEFSNFVQNSIARVTIQHLTIDCQNGIPFWLESALRKLTSFGLPMTILSNAIPASLLEALNESVGPYSGIYSW
jgi:hypothetical protein